MTAARTAIAALERERQRIAFDAAMYERFGADYPHARACFERRQAIDAEIAALKSTAPAKAAQKGADRGERAKTGADTALFQETLF